MVSAFLDYVVTGDCDTMTVTACLAPGTWYAFVAPDFDTNDPFECGLDYTATLDCVDCPIGACCFSDGSCSDLSEPACGVAGGNWGGPGTGCDPNECPQPPPNDTCDTAAPVDVNGANVIANNTVISQHVAGIHLFAEIADHDYKGAKDNVVFNNIVVGPFRSGAIKDVDQDNFVDELSNLIFGFGDPAWRALFVAPDHHDYHLRNQSSAHDAGLSQFMGMLAPSFDFEGESRPMGGGIDIGADEAMEP